MVISTIPIARRANSHAANVLSDCSRFWGPIRQLVEADDPEFEPNRDFKRDMVNVVVGTIWQTALVAAPFYFVLMRWTETSVVVLLAAATMIFLKKNWYDRLPAQ